MIILKYGGGQEDSEAQDLQKEGKEVIISS